MELPCEERVTKHRNKCRWSAKRLVQASRGEVVALAAKVMGMDKEM